MLDFLLKVMCYSSLIPSFNWNIKVRYVEGQTLDFWVTSAPHLHSVSAWYITFLILFRVRNFGLIFGLVGLTLSYTTTVALTNEEARMQCQLMQFLKLLYPITHFTWETLCYMGNPVLREFHVIYQNTPNVKEKSWKSDLNWWNPGTPQNKIIHSASTAGSHWLNLKQKGTKFCGVT